MLPLDSDRWRTLKHAYGAALDLPSQLRRLESPSTNEDRDKCYSELWGCLCHQGTVYPASFAAVPHFVRLIAVDPVRTPWELFALSAAIENSRLERGPELPADLREDYLAALDRIPALVAQAAVGPWDQLRCRALLGAIAAVRGFADLSGVILEELSPRAMRKLFEWRFDPPEED